MRRIPPSMLLLKLTPGVRREARALAGDGGRTTDLARRSTAPPARDLLVIRDNRRPDTVRVRREQLDLATSRGRTRFTELVGLPRTAARAVQQVLAGAPDDSRDEMAQLTRVLHRAEQGRLRLDRIVLSGHYAGDGIRGEVGDNGTLSFQLLRRLLRVFPRAAADVRHLMIAACYIGGRRDELGFYRELLPGLVDVTAYAARAPASASDQALLHLRRWSRATRRAGDQPITRDRVFGRCAEQEPSRQRRAAHRAHHGLVLAENGADRCR